MIYNSYKTYFSNILLVYYKLYAKYDISQNSIYTDCLNIFRQICETYF